MAVGLLAVFLLAVSFEASEAYITWIEARYPLSGNVSDPGSPWPLPQKWESSNTYLTLVEKEFTFAVIGSGDCNIFRDAFVRYKKYIFADGKIKEPAPKLDKVTRINIIINSPDCGYPQLGNDESYNLTVKAGTSQIHAETVWGALRGLETFSQLVYIDEKNKKYLIKKTDIKDYPSYKYRGVLLDTARHFLPMKVLKQNLDAMSFNKFNVFHWHIVDDQSFPFESKVFPNLTQHGAYSPRHVYTQEDMKEIIEFARLRGIRVMPEIDTPGHTRGFGKAFPRLITECYGDGITPLTPNYNNHSDKDNLNPTLEYTYDFFKQFFQEVKGIFKDEYIHLGMDEVIRACWESNPEIQAFMKTNNMTDVKELETYYVKRTINNIKNMGYKYITYQDPIDGDSEVPQDALIQVWKDTSLDKSLKSWQHYIQNIAKKNYQMIFSACWYLNYISYRNNWEEYYNCDPRSFDGTDKEKQLVIGGEACMWSEYVDGTNIMSRLWPRASAVAERLWSQQDLNVDDAKYRLDEHRCRMLRRGIPAQPILNGFCGDYEWDIDAKYPAEGCKGGAPTLTFALSTIFLAIFFKLFP